MHDLIHSHFIAVYQMVQHCSNSIRLNKSAIFQIPILSQEKKFYTIRKLQRLYLLCVRLYPYFTSITQHHNRKYGELHCACIQPATDPSKVSASLYMIICTIYSRQFRLLKKWHSVKNLNPWEGFIQHYATDESRIMRLHF